MTDYYLPTYGRRNPYFESLLKEGTNTSPIRAHSQGMSRLAFALLAGLERNELERGRRTQKQQMRLDPKQSSAAVAPNIAPPLDEEPI